MRNKIAEDAGLSGIRKATAKHYATTLSKISRDQSRRRTIARLMKAMGSDRFPTKPIDSGSQSKHVVTI